MCNKGTPIHPPPSLTPHVITPYRPPLPRRLQSAGFTVGQRYLELVSLRERPGKRETSVVGVLQFLSGTVWMQLFGKTADALEKSMDTANACERAGVGVVWRKREDGPGGLKAEVT